MILLYQFGISLIGGLLIASIETLGGISGVSIVISILLWQPIAVALANKLKGTA